MRDVVTVTRKEAKERGLNRYFTGKPCIKGHIAERKVNDGKCTKCKEEQDKKYLKEYASIYYARNKHTIKERVDKWRAENPVRVRNNNIKNKRNNRLRETECMRNWRRNNVERARMATKRYVHARRTAEGMFTNADIDALFESQGGRCLSCSVVFSMETPYTIDHDIPVSRGGTNWPSNLNLLCLRCNSSKGNRTYAEYITCLEIAKAN